MSYLHRADNRQGIKKERRRRGLRKVTVDRVVRSGIVKFKRKIMSWEQTLLERRLERKDRLATYL